MNDFDADTNPYSPPTLFESSPGDLDETPKKDIFWPGILFALVSNAGVVWAMLPLLSVEPGAQIRPMGMAMAVCGFGGIGVLLGTPVCILAAVLDEGWSRGSAILGLVLNLLPLPLAMFVPHLIANWIGYTFSE